MAAGRLKTEDFSGDPRSGSSANANVPTECPYMTSYLMKIVLFSIYFTISKIFCQNVHDGDNDLYKVKCRYINQKPILI